MHLILVHRRADCSALGSTEHAMELLTLSKFLLYLVWDFLSRVVGAARFGESKGEADEG